MHKIHQKSDDDRAPVARDVQGGKSKKLDQSKRGVKRDSDRNPTSRSQNPRPSQANTSGYQKQDPGYRPDSFYGPNKRQKEGHGGFNPVTKFKDQQGVSGENKIQDQAAIPKSGLKTNSNNLKSTSNWTNDGSQAVPKHNFKSADSIKSTSKLERRNSKLEANPGLKGKLASSASTSRPGDISKDAPRNEVKAESQSTPTTKWVSRRTPGKVDPSEPKIEWVRLPRYLTPQQQRVQKLLKKREQLPIFHEGPDIRVRLRLKDILILVGETGSGKSTQVPQFLYNEPWCTKQKFNVDGKNVSVGGVIAITQPRKIAATTLARRVAMEMGQLSLKDINGAIGYAVRFDQFTPKNMVIKFVTEGMLLQDLLEDPHLKKYSAVIVDEIHERTLDVDLVTGFLKRIVLGDKKARHGVPLKVVLMSATADITSLKDFFLDEEESNAIKERERNALELSNKSLRSSVSRGTSYSSWEGFSSPSNIQAVDESEASNKKPGDDMAMNNRPSPESSATLEEQVPKHNPLEHTGKLGNNIFLYVVKGRQYAVKDMFLHKPVKDYVDLALKTIHKIHTTRPYPGDILCFMTGEDDIKTLSEMLAKVAKDLNTKEVPFLKIMPLYGKMDAASQQMVFEPLKTKRTRKVVLATNVAETSVTVPGVKYVVDSGKVKVKEYRPALGLDSLLIKPVSKSSAEQRKGRAGRESEGECYRLYTAQQYNALADSDVPEILRTDILHAVLTMKARGVEDPMTFPLMNSPGPQAIIGALAQLLALGALSEDGSVTNVGRTLAIFPLSPAHGRVIVTASEIGDDCVLDAIDSIACLDADGDIFKRPSSEKEVQDTQSARDSLTRREGDILTILTAMRRYLAQPSRQEREIWCQQHQVNPSSMKNAILVREQLQFRAIKAQLLSAKPDKVEEFEPITEERGENLLKCFLRSFQGRTAVLHPDKSYRTIGGRNLIAIHPSSVLQGKKCEAILYLQQVYTTKHFAKLVNVIQMNWLMEALTHVRAGA